MAAIIAPNHALIQRRHRGFIGKRQACVLASPWRPPYSLTILPYAQFS